MARQFLKPHMAEDDIITREPTESETRSFRHAARALDKLGKAGFSIYLSSDTLNLMIGPSHDAGHNPRQDRVRESVTVCRASGGDW